jgi:coiled-coil domain-containing protein 12
MAPPQSSLSAAAEDRKARLAKLKSLKRKQPDDEIAPPESTRSPSPPTQSHSSQTLVAQTEVDVARLHLSGRNYDPETRGPKLGFESAPINPDQATLEELAADVAEEVERKAAEDAQEDNKGIDLFKLQPKKPNWDLKRDLEKKLEILNVRTDNAIARLVRERIANAQSAVRKVEVEGRNGDAAGVDGVALVEGLRVREREEAEEERREREEEEVEE